MYWSCSSDSTFYPKPKGYNRIDLPPHQYQLLKEAHPYIFEYSTSAIVQKDTFPEAEPHWIILYYPTLNARIQFTYKPLNGDVNKLQQHIFDAYKLVSKHQVKATSEKDQLVQLKNGKKAVVFQIEGEVPSHYQFYITDTTNNYLRGAVYLTEATKNDSLRPVIDYVKTDCLHLLETLEWKK